jgi:O-antigen ligase
LAVPLLLVASAEAVLGLVQFYAAPDGSAHCTYFHRNHFAGLLEMALPFAVAYPFASMPRRGFGTPPRGPWLRVEIGIVATALLLVAITHSLSRSGFGAAFGSLSLMAIVAIAKGRGRARMLIAIAAVAVLGILIVLAPQDRMFERFGHSFDSAGNLADMRLQVWGDTGRLMSDFPLFGCGLGGFQAVFNQYRTAALDVRIDYAHNDYLQALAELGLAGFAIVLILCGALLVEGVRAVRYSCHVPLALALVGALGAIAIHSLTDFNLHLPANALARAWVAGTASDLSVNTRKKLCP